MTRPFRPGAAARSSEAPATSRRFRFSDPLRALNYISFLLDQGITFQVFPNVNHVDVQTPWELAPQDFPHPKDLQP
jgi:hypothetical protein